jgi:hypothetical protein
VVAVTQIVGRGPKFRLADGASRVARAAMLVLLDLAAVLAVVVVRLSQDKMGQERSAVAAERVALCHLAGKHGPMARVVVVATTPRLEERLQERVA